MNENGNKRGLHIKKLPYAFTEQQSIFIMRAFREMRHYIKQNQQFVTPSEMRLVTVKMSVMSTQMASMSDRQKKNKMDDSERRELMTVLLYKDELLTETDKVV